MSDPRRNVILGASAPLAFLVLLVTAWGVDTVVSNGQVDRNVVAAGVPIGGLDEDDLRSVAADLNDRLATDPALLAIGDVTIETDLYDVGTRVDTDSLISDALAARSGGAALLAPFRWIGSFFNEVEIPVGYVVDHAASRTAAEALIQGQLAEPTEPYFDTAGPALRVVPGVDGSTIDFDAVGGAVEDALDRGAPHIVEVTPLALRPSLDAAVLQAVADEANAATSEPVAFRVLNGTAIVDAETLRSWVELVDADSSEPDWRINQRAAIDSLRPQYSALGDENQQAHFDVVDGQPIIIPASESVVCCEDDTGDRIKAGLLAPPTPFVAPTSEGGSTTESDDEPQVLASRLIELSPMTTGGDAGVAELEALGIVEEVSTFTTNHACCQNRVKNIQLMASIVRGHVILPGERFDLNDVVGQRTRAKGFLPAGAIAQGNLEDQVGGGVSQFTTTIFNAAFFAGIDFIEYQAHSLYFSRYPRGREATISWPKPDFVIENNTPYGILVWPTWTDTSITVTFYSTEHIDVQDLGRTERAQGQCTRVTTTRERTYPDGTSERDSVFAVYRPGEGLDCNGNSTDPNATTTTTEDPNATTTTTEDPNTTTTADTAPTTAPTTTATTAAPTTTTTVAPTTTTEATTTPTTAATSSTAAATSSSTTG